MHCRLCTDSVGKFDIRGPAGEDGELIIEPLRFSSATTLL